MHGHISTTLRAAGAYAIANNGGYIGLVGDAYGAGYTTWWDNLRVRQVRRKPAQRLLRQRRDAEHLPNDRPDEQRIALLLILRKPDERQLFKLPPQSLERLLMPRRLAGSRLRTHWRVPRVLCGRQQQTSPSSISETSHVNITIMMTRNHRDPLAALNATIVNQSGQSSSTRQSRTRPG